MIIFSLMICLFLPVVTGDEIDEPPVLHVDDTADIEKSMGKEIYVDGTILEAFWVRDSVLMLTFRKEREGFIAVSFKKYREELDKAFEGDVAKSLKGVSVRIHGVVEEYNYRPQIVIRDPKQIKLMLK